jgi:hypothetical protein
MNSCKRSVMAVAMLIVISMPVGLFVTWKVQQLIQKHEMMEKLEHAKLETITIPETAVEWYEEGREIIVDGRLFDVISWHKIPGTVKVSFTGLFDDAETAIKDKVEKLLRKKDKNDVARKLLPWLFSCPLQEVETISHFYLTGEPDFTLYLPHSIPIPDLSTPAPPPKA